MNPIREVTSIITPICPEETPRTVPENSNPPTTATIQRTARNKVSILQALFNRQYYSAEKIKSGESPAQGLGQKKTSNFFHILITLIIIITNVKDFGKILL
jgi:hypothetical protein